MERNKISRILAFVLTLCMLLGSLSCLSATKIEYSDTGNSDSLAEALKQLQDARWPEYVEKYASEKKYEGESIIIKASDLTTFTYTGGLTEADAVCEMKVLAELDGKSNVLQLPDIGTAEWEVNVPETGLYQIEWDYYPIQSKSSNIERTLRINGEVPFNEVRNILMTKIWKDDYIYDKDGNIIFEKDANGNDSRPDKYEDPVWKKYVVCDPTGYYNGNFYFYLEAGLNTISLDAQKEPVVLSEIRLTKVESPMTYEEYKKANDSKPNNNTGAAPIKIEAEHASSTSDKTIYPDNNRSSAVNSPQHASYIYDNVIGGTNWETAGQWIEYTVTVPESGYYKIYSRFSQATVQGLFVTRRLRVDGEIPFAEANNIEFVYDSDWQISAFGSANTEYEFYLEKGTHTFSLEVSMGNLGELVSRVRNNLNNINQIYLTILSITGPSPDSYQDYKFYLRMPDQIKLMKTLADELFEIAKQFEEITGESSSNQATLEKIARRLETMAKNSERQIAKNLSALKTDIGTLGTWLNNMQKQALTVDYFVVQPADQKLDTKTYRAVGNFFQNFGFELSAFFYSFIRDNSALIASSSDEKATDLTVWTTVSREYASIIRDITNNSFAMERPDIAVSVKVVAGGTLLPATFSGVGPDIMMDVAQSDAINYAVRGAVVNLKDCDNFYKLEGRFHDSSWTALTVALDSSSGEKAVFGIPQAQSFNVMFYRKDILADLGITKAPDTWNDFAKVTETLIANSYDVGLSSSAAILNIFLTMLYQKGGNLYTNDGTTISFDTDLALDAFTEVCEFYTLKKLPISYDAANRFRTGEMPVLVADYISFYNQFTVFASELKGLWGFTLLPGTILEDGSVNHTVTTAISCMVVMRDAEEKKNVAFDFMEWWTRTNIQSQYANELVAVLGPAGKYATANYQSFTEMAWSATESKILQKQFANLKGTPEMPGGYIIARYVNFAFLAAYNDGASPSDSLKEYVDTINREMERKRQELTRKFFVPTSYSLFD